jgi:hypothetical protein
VLLFTFTYSLSQKIVKSHVSNYTKDNVTFYLPRPFHFLSYQSNRLLRRSDLHSKISDTRIVLMTFNFLEPKTIIVDLTAKFQP